MPASYESFLKSAGNWTAVSPLQADGSSRTYTRVRNSAGISAILMESAPDSSPHATPGHRIADFLRLAAALRTSGLRAPDIYAAQPDDGLVLMEDFGDTSFHLALKNGIPPLELYGLAAHVLTRLRLSPPDVELPDYFESHVHKGHRRIVDWYAPAIRRAQNPDGLAESYLAAWQDVEKTLPPPACGFLHIDFHVDNLMWLPNAQGLDRCGLLDFQGAMRGPLAYDIANLLGDMRVDVPRIVPTPVLDILCAGMNRDEAASLRLWSTILSAQFHARMVGQVIRLALVNDKPRYMTYLPRLLVALQEDLKHPALTPIKRWLAENSIDLAPGADINPQEARPFIRSDAF